METTRPYCKDVADCAAWELRARGYYAVVPFTRGHYFVVLSSLCIGRPVTDQESREYLSTGDYFIFDPWAETVLTKVQSTSDQDYLFDLWDVDFGHY